MTNLYPTAHTLTAHEDGSPEWLAQRNEGLGSSDASTVLGLNPYKSAYTLWLEKTGKTIDSPDDRTRELFHWGHALEPLIREEAARRLNTTIIKPGAALAHNTRTWQRANLDGVTEDGHIFEAKNTGAQHRNNWIDQIPDHAEIQVHHSGAVTGLNHAHIAGLVGGNELFLHTITLNPNIMEMITEAEETFWQHVTTDTPPEVDGSASTYRHLTAELGRTRRNVEAPLTEARQLLADYWKARRAREDAERAETAAKSRLASLIGDGSALVTGNTTWATTRRGRVNETKLRQDHPDIYAACLTRQTFNPTQLKETHPHLYDTYQGRSLIVEHFDDDELNNNLNFDD